MKFDGASRGMVVATILGVAPGVAAWIAGSILFPKDLQVARLVFELCVVYTAVRLVGAFAAHKWHLPERAVATLRVTMMSHQGFQRFLYAAMYFSFWVLFRFEMVPAYVEELRAIAGYAGGTAVVMGGTLMMPPVAVFLGTSSPRSLRRLRRLKIGLFPGRVVSMLDHGAGTSWARDHLSSYSNFRTSAHAWREQIQVLLDMSRLAVVDIDELSDHVREELGMVASRRDALTDYYVGQCNEAVVPKKSCKRILATDRDVAQAFPFILAHGPLLPRVGLILCFGWYLIASVLKTLVAMRP